AIKGSTDSITIQDWYHTAAAKIEQIRFADGMVWDIAAVQAMAIVTGTDGNDVLYGTSGNDTFDGGSGNDILYGNNSYSGSGDDTYLFGAGAGQDTIYDYDTAAGNNDTIKITGKLPSEVTLSRSISGASVGKDLLITLNGTTDRLTVANHFANNSYSIEKIQFDDGTVWSTGDFEKAVILPTAAGAFYASVGNDMIDLRNAVASSVFGPSGGRNTGNDTYLFGVGAGQDTIYDNDSTAGNSDLIKITGRLSSEVTLSRSIVGASVGNDLLITLNGTTDRLTVTNHFANNGSNIEKIQFDDGQVWSTGDLEKAVILPTAAGAFYASSGNDVVDLRNAVTSSVYGPSGANNTGNDTYLFGV
ncbi:MAG: hypothetical protein H7835_20130, partial [Magnetococcus sp. XQGC-1]